MRIRIKRIDWVLVAILLLASVLRIWKLGSVPPHLTPDEASLGYNAYSILKTGHDLHNELFPVVFKSFGDFTPGLYVYLTVPFIALLGLSEMAVRLPNALFGVAAVYLIYLLVIKLLGYELRVSGYEKKDNNLFLRDTVALAASFLLAISPWHIYFSRGAWIPNVSLTLTLAGIYCFLRSLKKGKYLYLSAVFFSSTLLVYQGAKLTTLIVLLILGILYWQKLLSIHRNILGGSLLIGFVVTLPIILSVMTGKAGRLDVVSIFSYPRNAKSVEQILGQGEEKIGSVTYYFYHSETLNFVRAIMGRFFNHFSGRFLFFEGDWENPRHNPPNTGMILIANILFIIAGTYALANKKIFTPKSIKFILLWLLLSPIPSILTRDQVHAVRSYHMVVPIVLISAAGSGMFIQLIKNKGKLGIIIFGTAALLYAVNFIYYLDSYFVHMPIHNAKYWDYGYKQAVQASVPLKDKYQRIVFKQSYEQPFIYFLFYGIPGERDEFQKQDLTERLAFIDSNIGDVGLVEKLDNIEFLPISWPIGGIKKGDLVVIDGLTVTREMIGQEYKIVTEIKYPDSDTAYWILEK